ncbi:hypothetical protein GHT06_013845 [Daphnia sinensis]|uniref:Uncharacterized protein n=1 Tax=Daphnia sinensis TaxID=1820382 RepID=A0AAD5LCR2_9CRUS|nr:hypothetical protein GHT06_013845 [Daphnia sinensis]
MRFTICVLFLVISLALLEAVPAPQLTTIKRQPWKPKAIREKEAAKAAEEEAARKAEEAARKAEEAARAAERSTEVPEQTTVEHSTNVEEGTTVTIEQVTAISEETTTLLTETNTLPVEGKTPVEDVTESEALLTTVTDNPSTVTNEVSTLPVPIVVQDNLVANSSPNKRRIVTSRKLTKLMFSARGRMSALTKKDGLSAEAAACRLSLRGVPCHCRFEGTCRCDCGRRSNNQSAGVNRSLSLTN